MAASSASARCWFTSASGAVSSSAGASIRAMVPSCSIVTVSPAFGFAARRALGVPRSENTICNLALLPAALPAS